MSEREASYRKILEADLDGANTDSEKDRLTLGLASMFDNSPELMSELERYAESAKGDVELGVDEARGQSNFPLVSGFGGLLYKEFCDRFFMAPVHQQLVESVFSKYDSCARKTDFSELDEVRTGQHKSLDSRKIVKVSVTPTEIRKAGLKRQNDARAARTRAISAVPKARDLRKRPLEGQDALQALIAKKRGRRPTPASTRSVE